MSDPSIVPLPGQTLFAPLSSASRWALAVLLGASLGGCGTEPQVQGRNIVIVTMDTTRADHLGIYGNTLELTPRVDALAQTGVVFEDAYAPMPQTLPAHATIFTGLLPRDHGALENTYTLDDGYTTLAEICSDRGYDTGAFIGSLAVDDLTGIQQGFDTFDQPGGDWGKGRQGHPPQRKAKGVTSAALAWTEQLHGERPYMLWAHYYDPHGDSNKSFEPPERHFNAVSRELVLAEVVAREERFQGVAGVEALADFWRGYAAELRFTDEQIGRLLDGLERQGLLENTVVVVVGDHGEGLFEHGQKAHGTHLWEEMMRVPLVLVSPDGTAAGTRMAGHATLDDLLPTVMHMAFGAEHGLPRHGEGLDLWSAILAGRGLPERPVFLERPHFEAARLKNRARGQDLEDFAYGYLTAIVYQDKKLILFPNGASQLYDLNADPAELTDVSADHPELVSQLTGRLVDWMAAHKVGAPGETEVSDERLEHLRELGYLGDDDAGPGR